MNVHNYIRQKQEELIKERLGDVSYSNRVDIKDICKFLLSTGFSVKALIEDEEQFDLFCSTYDVGDDILKKNLLGGNLCIYNVVNSTDKWRIYNGIAMVFEKIDKVLVYDYQHESDLINYDEWYKDHYDMFFIKLQPIIT